MTFYIDKLLGVWFLDRALGEYRWVPQSLNHKHENIGMYITATQNDTAMHKLAPLCEISSKATVYSLPPQFKVGDHVVIEELDLMDYSTFRNYVEHQAAYVGEYVGPDADDTVLVQVTVSVSKQAVRPYGAMYDHDK